jgi:uncharacterized protein (TIGR00251 family)
MIASMLREVAGGVTLAVRAQPGAKKTTIVGVYGEGDTAQLKIAVQAPPVEGRANDALVAFLAETFSTPKRSIELVSGALSRSKVFLLTGVSIQQARSKLATDLRENSDTGTKEGAPSKLRLGGKARKRLLF